MSTPDADAECLDDSLFMRYDTTEDSNESKLLLVHHATERLPLMVVRGFETFEAKKIIFLDYIIVSKVELMM